MNSAIRSVRSEEPSFYASLIKSCRDLQTAKQIHGLVLASEHHRNIYISNLLIEMYGKCGSLSDARSVFEKLPERNLFSWNIILAAIAQNGGDPQEARALFDSMPARDVVSWTATIKAYAAVGAIIEARDLFDLLPERNIVSWNVMLAAYGEEGEFWQEVKSLFDRMPMRSIVSWNVMIQACANARDAHIAEFIFRQSPAYDVLSWNALLGALVRDGQIDRATEIFRKMHQRDIVSWNFILTAKVQYGPLDELEILFLSMPERDLFSWTALLNGFAIAGKVAEAQIVFDRMPETDLISWTMMIEAYALDGRLSDAMNMFSSMPVRDLVSSTSILSLFSETGNLPEAEIVFAEMPEQDDVSWTVMLAAYARNGDLERGRSMLDFMPRFNVVSWTAILAAYSHNGDLHQAEKLFAEMPWVNAVAWNVMITAYAQNGHPLQGISFFRRLNQEGFSPDESTFAAAFHACSCVGSLPDAKRTHDVFRGAGFPTDPLVGGVLIAMYGRCGDLKTARKMLDRLTHSHSDSPVPWSAMVAAYAHTGHSGQSLELFGRMFLEAVTVGDLTFVTILSACSHGGLLQQGLCHFNLMLADCCVAPGIQHYHCVIDLLGRLGRLSEAQELVQSMPLPPTTVSWSTLLGACKTHGDMRRAMAAASAMDPYDSAQYLLLSNAFMVRRSKED